MRTCSYYEELISRSLDGELSYQQHQELTVHLESCPACAQMWQLMAQISQMMEEDMEDVPVGLHEDIMAGVRRSSIRKMNSHNDQASVRSGGRHAAQSSPMQEKKRSGRAFKNILAAAACAAVVIIAALGLDPAGRAQAVVVADEAATALANGSPRLAEPSTASPAPTVIPTPEATAAPQQPSDFVPQSSESVVTTAQPQFTPGTSWIYQPTPSPSPQQPVGQPVVQGELQPVEEPLAEAVPQDIVVAPSPQPAAQFSEEPVTQEVPADSDLISDQESVSGGDAMMGTLPLPPAAEVPPAGIQPQQIPGSAPAGEELWYRIAPFKLLELYPALKDVSPLPEEDSQEADAAAPDTSPAPQPKDPMKDAKDLDLTAGDGEAMLKTLLGIDSQEDKHPEKAELPLEDCTGSYRVLLIAGEMHWEISMAVYGEDVYVTIAQLVKELPEGIEGELVQPKGEAPAAEEPVQTKAPAQDTDGGVAQEHGPQWYKVKFSATELGLV